VLVALGSVAAAREALEALLALGLAAPLGAALEAAELAAALEAGRVRKGERLPPRLELVPGKKAPAAPAAPAASASAPPAANGAAKSAAAVPAAARPAAMATDAAPAAGATAPTTAVDPMHRLLALSDANAAVGVAVGLINGGALAEAAALLDLVLDRHAANAGALAARGTARALAGELPAAVEDFSAAIAAEPRHADFWKRRGQARAALGDDAGALADLDTAAARAPDAAGAADARGDAARLRQRGRDYRRAEADARAALAARPDSPELLALLAACQVSQGDLEEGAAAYARVAAAQPDDADAALAAGMALKELCRVAPAEAELRRAAALGAGGAAEPAARKLLGQLRAGVGDPAGAAEEFTAALAAARDPAQRLELLLLRGGAHHAAGALAAAVADYQAALEAQAPGLSPEGVVHVCLAFYQKELALWARARLDAPAAQLCLDADFSPEFKELWCKKGPPSGAFVEAYHAAMQPQRPDWAAPRPRPPPPRAALDPLLAAADALGALVQYRHRGFLPNARQRRAAGLAALELAQLLRAAAAARAAGAPLRAAAAGASAAARGASGVGGGGRGAPGASHPLGWRDAMDVVVRWRQLVEPCDQVLWVDLLTEREFAAGFGSHTPMFTGQTKCVRYYSRFDRALALAKRLLLAEGRGFDAESRPVPVEGAAARAAVAAATTAAELWAALGRDAWVVVPVSSAAAPGSALLEGTRLTVVKLDKRGGGADGEGAGARLGAAAGTEAAAAGGGAEPPQPDAFEFSIRTPVTPARWAAYDAELAVHFDALLTALAPADGGGASAAADAPVADAAAAGAAALRFAYYWYNFMPLARGSALCGLAALLGALLAAGTPVRAPMPAGFQADWEAILESDPDAFAAAIGAWACPPELGGAPTAAPRPCAPPGALPGVAATLDTLRARVEALNGPGAPPV
jgi:hypothetical protein